ncbi:MAG: sigma-54 dependent transcriptional regulator [Pyrinomonadaceae bacterium]
MAKQKVLVVEDEELMRTILRILLEGEGYEVFTADSAEAAIRIFPEHDIAVTLTDIKMAGMDGLALLDQIKSIDEHAIVIIMTAFSSVDSAIAALRKGAYDYVTKPFVNEDLLQRVRNAVRNRTLFAENRALRRELNRQYNFPEIVGTSDKMQRVFELVSKVADTNSNILILGESGTGKELIARSLHFNSSRSAKPFLAVNCGALPESLLESELFGHTKGAFTGAVADKKGLFRSAEGGTIFLDEIGEMPLPLQVRLLRALQEHEVTPVGSSLPQKFDARIIAATNRDLAKEVEAGNFREDLFYRLNVIEISLPPLRDRPDDIPPLIRHFIAKTAASQSSVVKPVSRDTMDTLQSYSWPGNVREMENAVERAFILSGDHIGLSDLPQKVQKATGSTASTADANASLESVERSHILHTLNTVGGDKVEAARELGIDLSTLYRKLKKYEEG